MEIRFATLEDSKELLKIYGYYVKNTAISFEIDIPSLKVFSQRIEEIQKKYPYIVAEEDGVILGFAYANQVGARQAFNWSVETTIYINKESRKQGVGKKLYKTLEKLLEKMNVQNLYALIAYPVQEDEYLTKDSVVFHQHLGYECIGELKKCGYKFGNWYSLRWMEKHIKDHQAIPDPVININELYSLPTNGLMIELP